MKIDSSHIELSSLSYRYQSQHNGSNASVSQSNRSGGDRVSFSAEAMLRSAHASYTQSLSSVSTADSLTTHQLKTGLTSLVEGVFSSDALPTLSASINSWRQESTHVYQKETPDPNALQVPSGIQTYTSVAATGVAGLNIPARTSPADSPAAASPPPSRAAQGYSATMVWDEVIVESEQMTFRSTGRISTEDGRQINYMMELDMSRDFQLSRQVTVEAEMEEWGFIDPLVINLDGGAAGLTSGTFSFDLDADGDEENISFARQGTGFLALDRNYDGKINDGSELFGTGSMNGFDQLSRYDKDNNQWIDENDPIFDRLKVWSRDEDGNDQLISLKKAGVGAIYLDSASSSFELTDSGNNTLGNIRRSGVVLMEDGRVISMQELDLADQTPLNTDDGESIGENGGEGGGLFDSLRRFVQGATTNQAQSLEAQLEKARLAAELSAAQSQAQNPNLTPEESNRLQQKIEKLRAEHNELSRSTN